MAIKFDADIDVRKLEKKLNDVFKKVSLDKIFKQAESHFDRILRKQEEVIRKSQRNVNFNIPEESLQGFFKRADILASTGNEKANKTLFNVPAENLQGFFKRMDEYIRGGNVKEIEETAAGECNICDMVGRIYNLLYSRFLPILMEIANKRELPKEEKEWKDVEEVKKKIGDTMKNVNNVVEKIKNSDIFKSFKENSFVQKIGKVFEGHKNKLSNISEKFHNKLGQHMGVFSKITNAFHGRFGGILHSFGEGALKVFSGLTKGVEKGLKVLGVTPRAPKIGGSALEGLAGAAIGAVGILGGIFTVVKQILQKSSMLSGFAKATLQLFQVTVGLILKPIGDLFGMILIPILVFAIKHLLMPMMRIWNKIAGFLWKHSGAASIGGMAGAGIGAILGMMFGGPLGAILGGVAGMAIGGLLGPAISWLLGKLKGVFKAIGHKFREAGDFIEKKFTWKNVDKAIHWIGGKIKGALEFLAKGYIDMWKADEKIWKKIFSWVKSGGEALKGAIDDLWRGLKKEWTKFVSKLSGVKKDIDNVWKSGEKKISDAIGDLKGVINTIIDKVKSFFNDLKNVINTILKPFEDMINSLHKLSGKHGVVHSITSGLSSVASDIGSVLGHLQVGGYISRTGTYLMHEGEMVIPAWKVPELVRAGAGARIEHLNVNVTVDSAGRSIEDIDDLAHELAHKIMMEIAYRGGV